MKLRDFWRLLCPSAAEDETPVSDELLRPIASAALADLERNLDIWAMQGREREQREPSKELAVVGQRVEKELRRFFGRKALRYIQSSAGESVDGTAILFADRLFVAFLGRRAAMAVTRKLYSRLT
jgi:hypothetical protein